ncbi:MAG TPA: alpha/beta hydrolase [Candidatus Binataceae bacterium]|nr:alpha/beta hydrolase [Candidatus Binataceae bacterium]
MTREDFSFRSNADGLEVACYRWPADANPVGVVQIAHGMGEHSLRYADLAGFLNRAGFHVYANDHRGHGRTAKSKEQLGDFGAGGWDALVEDMAHLTRLTREREHLPVVLLGHSMGSFAAQSYIVDHSDLIAAVALSGSAAVDKLQMNSSGDADLTALNADFEPARTPFDWLSRDPVEVEKYIADPLCGFGVIARSMASMAAASARIVDPAQLARIRKDLPIWIMAGDKDPVNHHLEWLRPLAERYRAAGIRDVTEKYYLDGRHEMFNETNRAEVYRDLLAWTRTALRLT